MTRNKFVANIRRKHVDVCSGKGTFPGPAFCYLNDDGIMELVDFGSYIDVCIGQ